ncbi:unnamed protein product [Schistocephalus solidus]|uniref:Uncharacterized protein n=1 Tax=Schistocephalus solidus TaxID=70667 RepID=A0A183TPD3_SCHSO|nr:unnamed protein product [Schistocephalus solidus]
MSLRRTTPHSDKYLLLPFAASENDLDVPTVEKLAPAELCLHPEASQQDVLVTNVIPGADGFTDNHLVISSCLVHVSR